MNRDAIISKAKGAIGKVQPLVAGSRMYLLKREPHSQALSVVHEFAIPFWSRWSSFREATVFMWADTAVEWMDRVAQSSFVGYGVPTGDRAEIDVYEISFDQRDRVMPNAGNLLWELYGTRLADERFEIPEEV